MKKLGLVGGTGPESTIPYYHDIVYGVRRKLGTNTFPNLTIESIDVFQVLGLCADKKYAELTEYLVKAVDNLYKAGAEFAALTGNTPHIVFDELQRKSPIPIISMIETTCNQVKKGGFTKIGLLGTAFTMNEDFFKSPFLAQSIDIVTPRDEEKEFINAKISNELELGIVKEETRKKFIKIVHRMQESDNIQALILGCTELPLLFNNVTTTLPLLDTMQIHIEVLVNEIVKG